MLFPATLFDAWRNYSERRREEQVYRNTVNAVSDLPPHILKDIGWPGGYDRQRVYR